MFWDKKDQKTLSNDAVTQALGAPDWLSGVRVEENGRVTLIIEADPNDMERAETLKIEAEARAMSLEGVSEVNAVLTAQRQPGQSQPQSDSAPLATHASPRRVRKGRSPVGTSHPSQANLSRRRKSRQSRESPAFWSLPAPKAASASPRFPSISPRALPNRGCGLDCWMPTFTALRFRPCWASLKQVRRPLRANKLVPVSAHGIETLSIGYLTDPDSPMIWRGTDCPVCDYPNAE